MVTTAEAAGSVEKQRSMVQHSFFGVLLVAALPAAIYLCVANHRMVLGWIIAMLLMLLFTGIVGRMTVGTWRGALVDDRNVISLSRFQMLLWTILALSAFMTAAIFNAYIGVDEPVAIQVPSQLWTLIGISTTSLVAAPMLVNQKKTKESPDEALEGTKEELRRQGAAPEMVKAEGQILVNKDPLVAQWSDMLTGDEVSNGAHVDLAKLQMFFFTILTVFVYGAALVRMFEGAQLDGLTQFPIMDQSIIALIGISHSGYLLNKAVPRPTSRP